MGCSLPGSSVHGTFQAGILEWVAISFSRGSSQLRDQTRVSRIVGRRFTVWATQLQAPQTWWIWSTHEHRFFSRYQTWPQGGSISSCSTAGFFVVCFLVFIFGSSRVDFRCVCFKSTGTWFSYAWTYLYSLSGSFPILVLSVCSVDFPVLFRYFGLSIW